MLKGLRWSSEPTTPSRFLRSACALMRHKLRRLLSTTGLRDVSRKWMETGRSQKLRPELFPPLSGCARKRSEIQKSVSGKAWHIEAINHSLFAPGDPNLATFHQGGIGDCYLLAVIGTFVYQHPQTVRTMIQPQADGTFQVHFGNGKNVKVEPMTDAELIMGASEGRAHGVWLSVLEKAYARIDAEAKERKTGEEIESDDAVTTDFIGHGGYYGPVIVLLTGHKAAGAPLGRWVKQDSKAGIEKAHELLAKLSSEHKLMAVLTGKDKTRPLPKGIVHGHIFGVLGYDAARRMVVVFNPWGNHVKPAGRPGLVRSEERRV